MKIKSILCGILFTLCGISLHAQDIHFSQFYQSPLNLNPALTGVMNCNKRLVVNYRNQWAAAAGANAYNTFSASYDQKLPVGQRDYFGVGGTLWSDVAGELNFGTTQGRFSFSFSKFMGGSRKKANYLVAGADAGITQRRVNLSDARWPSQHDGNGRFDPSFGNPEIINNPQFLYADVSLGLIWFSVLDEATNYYVGAAMHHLNQANVSFLEQQSVSLYSRYTAHAGGQFPLTPRVSILPGILAMIQGPHREYNGGVNFRFRMGASRTSNQYFQVGAWYRGASDVDGGLLSDAIILNTRFEQGNYSFGFSYDWTVSTLSQAGAANGAFEFSMNYLICGDESRAVYCPTF